MENCYKGTRKEGKSAPYGTNGRSAEQGLLRRLSSFAVLPLPAIPQLPQGLQGLGKGFGAGGGVAPQDAQGLAITPGGAGADGSFPVPESVQKLLDFRPAGLQRLLCHVPGSCQPVPVGLQSLLDVGKGRQLGIGPAAQGLLQLGLAASGAAS